MCPARFPYNRELWNDGIGGTIAITFIVRKDRIAHIPYRNYDRKKDDL